VPLKDDGLAAPVVVKLNGLTKLRLTTGGNCNPNYFMLVPASGTNLTARLLGGNRVLSFFPSQAGVTYRVFYPTNLAAGNRTLLTTLLGNGGVKSVSDAPIAAGRFYKVVAPYAESVIPGKCSCSGSASRERWGEAWACRSSIEPLAIQWRPFHSR